MSLDVLRNMIDQNFDLKLVLFALDIKIIEILTTIDKNNTSKKCKHGWIKTTHNNWNNLKFPDIFF